MVFLPRETVEEYEKGEYEIEIEKTHFDRDKLPSFQATIYHDEAPFGIWKSEWDYAHEYQDFIGLVTLKIFQRLFNSQEELNHKRIEKLKRKVEKEINRRERAMK